MTLLRIRFNYYSLKQKTVMKNEVRDQVFLSVEELDQRIAPGLTTDLGGVDLGLPIICPPPPPPDDCPPPPPEDCPPPSDTSDGGNNGYGNDGYDGVPGDSGTNDSPNADEKQADKVR